MIIIKYSSSFLLTLKKADVKIRKSFRKRISQFSKNPYDSQLDNHALHDEWKGYRSIDVTNDWRAVYIEKIEGDETIAYFVAIGTHDLLYKKGERKDSTG